MTAKHITVESAYFLTGLLQISYFFRPDRFWSETFFFGQGLKCDLSNLKIFTLNVFIQHPISYIIFTSFKMHSPPQNCYCLSHYNSAPATRNSGQINTLRVPNKLLPKFFRFFENLLKLLFFFYNFSKISTPKFHLSFNCTFYPHSYVGSNPSRL